MRWQVGPCSPSCLLTESTLLIISRPPVHDLTLTARAPQLFLPQPSTLMPPLPPHPLHQEYIMVASSCWAQDPDARPAMSDVLTALTSLLALVTSHSSGTSGAASEGGGSGRSGSGGLAGSGSVEMGRAGSGASGGTRAGL